jgi:hypothetical protein
MGRRVADHSEQAPASRRAVPADVEFFPGEAARLLRLDGIDYSQLRQLYVLARRLRGAQAPGRGWSRFTLADLAAVEVLVELGGGRDRLAVGRRLVLGRIQATCVALVELGFDNPLLQVPLKRDGRRILARIDAYVFEPATGQLVIDDVAGRVGLFLEDRLIKDRRVRAAINAECRRLRPRRRRSLVVDQELGTLQALA